jgi:hypothetical protein
LIGGATGGADTGAVGVAPAVDGAVFVEAVTSVVLVALGAAPLVALGDGCGVAAASVAGAPASAVDSGTYVVPSGRRGASQREGTVVGSCACADASADHHETTKPIQIANKRFTNQTLARDLRCVGAGYSAGQTLQLSCRCRAARSHEALARAQRGSVGGAPSRSPVSAQSSRDAWQIESVARHTSRHTPADARNCCSPAARRLCHCAIWSSLESICTASLPDAVAVTLPPVVGAVFRCRDCDRVVESYEVDESSLAGTDVSLGAEPPDVACSLVALALVEGSL